MVRMVTTYGQTDMTVDGRTRLGLGRLSKQFQLLLRFGARVPRQLRPQRHSHRLSLFHPGRRQRRRGAPLHQPSSQRLNQLQPLERLWVGPLELAPPMDIHGRVQFVGQGSGLASLSQHFAGQLSSQVPEATQVGHARGDGVQLGAARGYLHLERGGGRRWGGWGGLDGWCG